MRYQPNAGRHLLRKFFNKCWSQNEVPDIWHSSQVVCIFKKGSPEICENYRPISLLCVSYKIFASILLSRLKNAGAEEIIFPTQFGFRAKYGTREALFAARRMLEQVLEDKSSSAIFLALDWAQALDCICPPRLLVALKRFGIPDNFVRMVMVVYENRKFCVKEAGSISEAANQNNGILQGCPLSSFLFSILMSVLIMDAQNELKLCYGVELSTQVHMNELLYTL